MLRIVLDVNVLVSAAIGRDSPPTRLIRASLEGAFELVVSSKLLEELDRVLAAPRIANRVSARDLGLLRDALERDAIHVDDPAEERIVGGDPGDDYLVALARAAGAHAIVTGDRHLLELEDLRPPALEPRPFLDLVERVAGADG